MLNDLPAELGCDCLTPTATIVKIRSFEVLSEVKGDKKKKERKIGHGP